MKADINVTPLIDVLLVLLILFMVVAPMAPTALDATAAESSKQPGPPDPKALVLEIRPTDFALNGQVLLSTTELSDRLREGLAGRGDRPLFVKVAQGVVYERVVLGLDLARDAGAERIGLVEQTAAR